MKKYTSLLIVLLVVFGTSFTNVKAEEIDTNEDAKDLPIPTLYREGDRLEKQERLKLNQDEERNLSDVQQKFEIEREKLKQEREEVRELMKNKLEEMKKAREAIREEEKNKMEALREEIKKEKDIEKAKREEERLTGREQAFTRFIQIEKNLNTLKDRINLQIANVEAKGINATGAKTLVSTAETKMVALQAKVTEANALFTVSTNELSAETKTKLRILAQEIQTLVKDTHKALNNAVKSLKDAVKAKLEAEKAAATSPTTTTPTPTETTN